ncbi:MAG TPA: TetR/AcrR family transcriptional regulator [Chitinophagaceae bacterium]|nr:TetR/AcrR family transcriptional regulator [Chitinophagaceae bacterium]HPH32128.1 TetR/AcrR family transcriptional regulator [Chitinophagaceae bacterium]
MELHLQIKMNGRLFLKDPQLTVLGQQILQSGVLLIHEIGFEQFTFKKLAETAGTTEAGVYRYFENKHRLLLYLVSWYWNWLDYQISYCINNISQPELKIRRIIRLLALPVKDDQSTSYINESVLHEIVVEQGTKAYLTKQVTEDNQHQFFKPYKDLCSRIGGILLEYNTELKFPRSLSSSLIEIAHLQKYFKYNLPSLTDFGTTDNDTGIVDFLEEVVFSSLIKKPAKP